ncbi:MAG: NADH-quinone oxidoreductase subunit C [Solirubrobacteraceae bacterium]|nr:NADH-quinone oxidoreductase subunit C [Patulibacter sp.]
MPDPTGLELLAGVLRSRLGDDAVVGTTFHRGHATIEIDPEHVVESLSLLRHEGYRFLSSVHGADEFPAEPRLAVHYELLDMQRPDRVNVKLRVPTDAPIVASVTPGWPTADHQEREIYDLLGVIFEGHPDLRRILMPEDYEGHPQRRDFPIGGEPVLFTHHEADGEHYPR